MDESEIIARVRGRLNGRWAELLRAARLMKSRVLGEKPDRLVPDAATGTDATLEQAMVAQDLGNRYPDLPSRALTSRPVVPPPDIPA